MTKYYVTILVYLFLFFNSVQAQPVRLVKDITPGPGSTFASGFTPVDDGIIFGFGNSVLFIVKDSDKNFNLWVSDGEEDGTYLLHGLTAGSSFNGFVNGDDDYVYYLVESATEGKIYALSKTTLDTMLIHTNPKKLSLLTYLNGILYFKVDDTALHKVDPNTQMSELVYQFGSFRGLRDIGILNNGLILIGGEANGTELYYSDGTTEGTKAYYQLNTGSEFSGDYYMTEVDDKLFFFYDKPLEPYVLHVTDGTAAGTKPLIQLERIAFIDLEKRRSIIGWDGKLFFRGRDLGKSGDELFVSDGTVAGSFKININDEWSKPAYFTPYNDQLYFMADDLGSIFNVYKTDGTQAGTVRAIDAWDLGSGISFGGSFMVEHKDSLYFYAYRFEVGEELWVSGGSTDNTKYIDIVPGSGSSVPTQMTSTDKYLFLICKTPEFGKELFVVDPATVSTQELFTERISVYPNPFANDLIIDMEGEYDHLILDILDLDGKLVFSRELSGRKVELPELPRGAYFAVLKTNGLSFSKLLFRM
jgi:ELWxxDGT repeat protein